MHTFLQIIFDRQWRTPCLLLNIHKSFVFGLNNVAAQAGRLKPGILSELHAFFLLPASHKLRYVLLSIEVTPRPLFHKQTA